MVFKEVGNEFPEEWKPTEVGETLEGIYARKKTEVGPKKGNLYIFDVDGKAKAVWGCKVLDDKMDDLKISLGDVLKITYEGKDEKKGYHKFKIEKDFPNTDKDLIDESIPDPVTDAAEEAEESE